MKKKSVLYIFVALLGLLFNSFVLAEEEGIEVIDLKESPAYTIKGFNECSIEDKYSDYVSISVNGGDSTFLKIADPIGSGTVKFSTTCKSVINKKDVRQFTIEMKAVSEEEANDKEKYLDYPVTVYVNRRLTMYKSCSFAEKDNKYISIDNRDDGVMINVLKANKDVELNCITKHGKDAKVHLHTSFYADTSTTSNNVEFKKGQATTTTLSQYEYCYVNNNDPYVRPVQVNGMVGLYVRKSYTGKENAHVTEKLSCAKKSDNTLETLSVAIYGGVNATPQSTIDNFYITDVSKNVTDTQKKVNLYNYNTCTLTNKTGDGNISFSSSNYHSVADISGPGTFELSCNPYDTSKTQKVTITVSASPTFGDEDDDNNQDDNGEYVPADCVSILGSVNEEGTVAYVLQKVFNFMKILGPILVLVMTILDSVKAVTSGDKDELSKLLKKTAKRMIYAVLLFVFPTILNLILGWVTVHGTCYIK